MYNPYIESIDTCELMMLNWKFENIDVKLIHGGKPRKHNLLHRPKSTVTRKGRSEKILERRT